MRVLVVHNRYRSATPSGENDVVDDDVVRLRAAGVEVETYFRESDEIEFFNFGQKAGLIVSPIYGRQSAHEVSQALDRFRPDVVHLHNPYPLLSPYVIRVVKRRGTPVVQTVHNYRHVCMKGTFFRDNQICLDCSGRTGPVAGIMHGCYRQSRPQSAVMALTLMGHRSTWRLVDRFLPVSDFIGQHLMASGVSPGRIQTIRNSVRDPGEPTAPGSDFLFAGRFDREKGISLLLQAWEASRMADRSLTILGDGPLRDVVERAAVNDRIVWLGRVSKEEVGRQMRASGVVVVPSTWYEGLPLTVAEAYSHGRPVIVSDHGGLSEVVTPETGWRVGPTVLEWVAGLELAASADLSGPSLAARAYYDEHLRPAQALAQLLKVYNDVAKRPETAS